MRQLDRLAGEVGAVVVIFDEDRDDRYQYLTTWLGEHQNESDMAFYSTHPVRPHRGSGNRPRGVRRIADDAAAAAHVRRVVGSRLRFRANKPERLLMAALDYSIERFVVYVAAKPPRSIFRSIASHLNRNILYVPIGALSPTKLKKLRVVHVLDSYERRERPKTTSGRLNRLTVARAIIV